VGMTYAAAVTVKVIKRESSPRLIYTEAGLIETQRGTTFLVEANELLQQTYRRDYLKREAGKSVLRDKFTLDGQVWLVKQPPKDLHHADSRIGMRFEVELEQF